MKPRIQFTPALTAALLCSFAWFALWLTAFRPGPETPIEPKPRPAVSIRPAIGKSQSPLQSPTLFALPSEKGFSGSFPEGQVDIDLSLEQPRQPEIYLPRQTAAAPAPDQTELIERISLPQNKLPAPGAAQTAVIRKPEPVTLFFSPELQPRAAETKIPANLEAPPVASARIHLTVRPDGTVAHAFFETPMEHPALLGAIRRLRFAPAPETTSGRLDIRFNPILKSK